MMKMKTVAGLVSCALYLPFIQAQAGTDTVEDQVGSMKVANSSISVAGGIGAGMLYSNNTGGANNTSYEVTDFLVELSAPADKGIGFTAGYGLLRQPTMFANVPYDKAKDPSASPIGTTPTGLGAGLQYGWLTIKPSDTVTIEAGELPTKVGYEGANTLLNANIQIASIWTAQPVFLPGARATFTVGNGSIFIEGNEDTSQNATSGFVVGGSTAVGGVNLAATYYNATNYNDAPNKFLNANGKAMDVLDLIASSEIGGVPVAANFDYHKVHDQTAGLDDSAIGLALYATPSISASFTLPIRIEYMNDGTSGVYSGALGNGGVNTAYTFTITPTYHYTKNTFVRAELSTFHSDNKVFMDASGNATKDSKNTAILQAGYLF